MHCDVNGSLHRRVLSLSLGPLVRLVLDVDLVGQLSIGGPRRIVLLELWLALFHDFADRLASLRHLVLARRCQLGDGRAHRLRVCSSRRIRLCVRLRLLELPQRLLLEKIRL